MSTILIYHSRMEGRRCFSNIFTVSNAYSATFTLMLAAHAVSLNGDFIDDDQNGKRDLNWSENDTWLYNVKYIKSQKKNTSPEMCEKANKTQLLCSHIAITTQFITWLFFVANNKNELVFFWFSFAFPRKNSDFLTKWKQNWNSFGESAVQIPDSNLISRSSCPNVFMRFNFEAQSISKKCALSQRKFDLEPSFSTTILHNFIYAQTHMPKNQSITT